MIQFFYGTDAFRIREALAKTILEVKNSYGLAMDTPVFRMYPSEENPEKIFAHLEAPDLFQGNTLAIIENIGAFSKHFREALQTYCAKSGLTGKNDTTLLYTLEIDGGSKKTREAGDAIAKNLISKGVRAVRFDALSGQVMQRWLIERAVSLGVVLPREVAELCITTHGTNSEAIAKDMERLSLFLKVAPEKPLKASIENFKAISSANVTEEAFKLIDAIGARNHKAAFAILLRLFAMEEDPIKLTGLLAYALRAMLSVKELDARPINPADAAQITGLQDWQIRQYRQATVKFSLEDLKKFYERLLGVDYKTKTGEGNPRLLLERLLLSI